MIPLIILALFLAKGLLCPHNWAWGDNKMGNYIKEDHFYLFGRRVAQEAIKKFGPDYNGHLLILTNAGIVKTGEGDTSLALEALKQITACSPEKKSLIVINSAIDQLLYFFFFQKKTGDSFFVQTEAPRVASIPVGKILSRDLSQLCCHIIFKNVSLGRLMAEAEEMASIFARQPYGKKWASLINFAHFLLKDPPSEIIRVAQFHDHICPGVLSGYYISRFLANKFPLREKEKYFFLSTPPYCKDDALQIIFNQTVGKKGMAALLLAEEDRALLLPEARETAGIYFRYDPQTSRGQGAVLGFAWSKLLQDCQINSSRTSFLNSLKQILFMIDQRDEYARYVYFIKIFDLPPGENPQNYARLGINPWQKLGLWSKKD